MINKEIKVDMYIEVFVKRDGEKCADNIILVDFELVDEWIYYRIDFYYL